MNVLYQKYILNITKSNLLNAVLHFGFTMLLKQWEKEKKWKFSNERAELKQNAVAIMISEDGKGNVFPVKLKQEGEFFG